MHSKNSAWTPWLGGLALLVAGCSNGGGEGGGSFYVETCTLGCTNGEGGTQVTCGVVNTYENQDVALLFSSPVSLASVNKQSFQVFDVTTGAVPAGTFLIDPANENRLIFRPKLSFDSFGNPVFGFLKNASYQIKLNGVAQKDPEPYVQSMGSSENQARVLCTITTDQGIIDPVPGKPTVAIFAQRVDPGTGAVTTVPVVKQPPFPDNVSSSSQITFVFDELMNVGTVVIPSTGQAPFIRVEFDSDGLLTTTNDRLPIDGSFAFSVDQAKLKTTAVFTPFGDYPSSGSNPTQPRLVVVRVPVSVADIAGNGVGNAGEFAFAPQFKPFNPVTISEDFSTTTFKDAKRTGADWDTATPQLAPGVGGGPGRLGDLVVAAGQSTTLYTSPVEATGTIQITKVPINNDRITINGVLFLFKTNPGTVATNLAIRAGNIPWTVSSMVDKINAYALANPTSAVAEATYVQSSSDTMRVIHKTPGSVGNSFTIAVAPAGTGATPGIASGPELAGGADGNLFPGRSLLTNFDFAGNPGATPPDELVSDGLFRFSSVEVEPGATLLVKGADPLRLLARGNFDLQDTGVLDVSGQDRGKHISATPYGQRGASGGPGGAAGGRGGDRASNPTGGLTGSTIKGVIVASSVLDGSPGGGVGGNPTKGAGVQGPHWPPVYPTDVSVYNDLGVALDPTGFCSSGQVGGAGSGGAYSTDGGIGRIVPKTVSGLDSNGLPACNVPPNKNPGGGACPTRYDTPAGTAFSVGLEDPNGPLSQRLLTPFEGYLRGGSGGGGGGGHLFGVNWFDFTTNCGFTTPIALFLDSSSAGGGGGGGAVQVQAGNEARIAGKIDASGGQGGSDDTSVIEGKTAMPGGGGSGGAVLLQADQVVITASPDLILIPGGAGGASASFANSSGGKGGNGLVRVEGNNGLTANVVASSVNPTDPTDPTSKKWLSVGTWSYDPTKTFVEEAQSGAQSCWIKPVSPQGTYVLLDFQDDPTTSAPPSAFGWNLDVVIDFGGTTGVLEVPYRGSDGSGPYGGMYPEEAWGTDLGEQGSPGAPLVVRFQGARTNGVVANPCDADPNDPQSGLQFGSRTPWVQNPTELEFFNPPPDIVRFVILFDASANTFGGTVLGVKNLRIEAQPE